MSQTTKKFDPSSIPVTAESLPGILAKIKDPSFHIVRPDFDKFISNVKMYLLECIGKAKQDMVDVKEFQDAVLDSYSDHRMTLEDMKLGMLYAEEAGRIAATTKMSLEETLACVNEMERGSFF